jgi:outer membrane protein assembly factor BamA
MFVSAQGLGGGMGGENGRIEGKSKFMPLPYVNYDRSLGFTIGAIPMLMFNPSEKDTLSPSSLVGALGAWTTGKSWFVMGFGMFYLNEDRWRISTAGGLGAVNFQFYLDHPIGGWIPYQSEADFFMLKVERKLYESLYGGISYVYADVITSSENLPVTDSLTLHGLGLSMSLDKRSNPYYPRKGYQLSLEYNTFPGFLGNKNISQKIELTHNHFFPVRQNKDVLAGRLHLGLGLGDLGFNQQFIVRGPDIRGYAMGGYRGNQILAVQGEYRWNFHHRWGAVGFAGVATVFNTINESDNGKLLPGIGTGIRFRAFPENNFSVGLDVAAGIDDWGIYFQIGEAF